MTMGPVLTFAGGPVEVNTQTLRDQARPILYHYDPAFIEIFSQTCQLLQQAFRTQHDVVIMQGEALLGLEAVAASLISPGDKVLNLVSGVFGKGYESFIERYGGETIELAVPYNESLDPDDVRRELEQHPEIKELDLNPVFAYSKGISAVDARIILEDS